RGPPPDGRHLAGPEGVPLGAPHPPQPHPARAAGGSGAVIYIRNKAEALDAVAAVLALPERRQQIVQLTVRVAMCLDAEARSFLADCQAGLIEGGLDYMRKRRHDLLAARQEEGPEAIVIVDSSEDQLLEQVGMALDALRLSEIVRQVFPAVREKHAPWEIARAFLAGEEELR